MFNFSTSVLFHLIVLKEYISTLDDDDDEKDDDDDDDDAPPFK